MKRYALTLLIVIVIVFVGYFFVSQQPINSSNVVTLRVGLALSACSPSELPFLVAKEKGYFQTEGFNVLVSKEKMEFGDADSLTRSFDIIIVGRARQYYMEATDPGKFKVFTVNYLDSTHPNYAILMRKDAVISSLGQLEDKIIGVDVHSGRARFVLMRKILEKNGLDPARVQLRDASVEELISGQVDALYIREPELSLALHKGDIKILVDEPIAKYIMNPWPMSFSSFSNKFLQQKPEAARNVIRVFDRAIDFIRENPENVIGFLRSCMQENYGTSTDVRQLAHWKLEETQGVLETIQTQIDLYYQTGLIPNKIEASEILFDY